MARIRSREFDQKRESIKNTSVKLFSDTGYHATSMSQVAAACGTSKGLLYHYYTSKEELLFDILQGHLEELLCDVKASIEEGLPAEEQLHKTILALLDSYHDKDKEHRVQIHELPHLPEDKQKILRDMERQIVEPVHKIMLQLLPETADKEDYAKPSTMTLFGVVNWCFMWLRPEGKLSRQDYAAFVTRLFLNGLREV